MTNFFKAYMVTVQSVRRWEVFFYTTKHSLRSNAHSGNLGHISTSSLILPRYAPPLVEKFEDQGSELEA